MKSRAELFFDGDQLSAESFCSLICSRILAQTLVEGLNAHITAVCHQFCDGCVAVVHGHLYIGFEPGHAFCHKTGFLFFAVVAKQKLMDFVAQLFVVVPAFS